jgi:spore cortex biosynthesis protein YabQ
VETRQLETFVCLLVTGIALSFLFDCYRLMRGTVNPRGVITAVTDLLFWLLATAVVFAVLLKSNGGEMRLYVFISLIGGVLVYYQLLSRRAIKIIRMGLKKFQVLVLQPFFYTLRGITYPFRWLVRKTQPIYRGAHVRGRQLWHKLETFFK